MQLKHYKGFIIHTIKERLRGNIMKLNEFLKHPSFSKYAKEVEEFQEEFIQEGCEAFLWPNFNDKQKAMEFTCKLAEERGAGLTNPKIQKFIEQIAAIDEKYIVFIYPEDYSPKYLMAQEVAKNAKQSYVMENIFEEDDTKNWIAIFEREDVKSIGMMYHIVYSSIAFTGDNYGGYKLFGRGLMYYADCLQYNGQPLEPEWPNLLAHFQGNAVRRDTNPRIILESRKVSQMLVRLGYFKDEYEIFYNLYKVLLPFLHTMWEKTRTFLEQEEGTWSSDVKELQSQMVADGIIVSKWKSEQTLFTLVKKEYPDALFQFRPRWLEPQNLDIYIPSLNMGIEYQGIQHYESIDFFGGEEAFVYRQKLDARKKNLCDTNGLRLLAWPYTDEISMKNLKKKIAETI